MTLEPSPADAPVNVELSREEATIVEYLLNDRVENRVGVPESAVAMSASARAKLRAALDAPVKECPDETTGEGDATGDDRGGS